MNQEQLNKRLMDAAWEDDLYKVKEALDKGADIHILDDYALRFAARNGYLDVVKYLVEQGADIHVQGDYALRWAARHGHLEVVKYLVEKGADIHARNNSSLIYAKERGYHDVVTYLSTVEHNYYISKKYHQPTKIFAKKSKTLSL